MAIVRAKTALEAQPENPLALAEYLFACHKENVFQLEEINYKPCADANFDIRNYHNNPIKAVYIILPHDESCGCQELCECDPAEKALSAVETIIKQNRTLTALAIKINIVKHNKNKHSMGHEKFREQQSSIFRSRIRKTIDFCRENTSLRTLQIYSNKEYQIRISESIGLASHTYSALAGKGKRVNNKSLIGIHLGYLQKSKKLSENTAKIDKVLGVTYGPSLFNKLKDLQNMRKVHVHAISKWATQMGNQIDEKRLIRHIGKPIEQNILSFLQDPGRKIIEEIMDEQDRISDFDFKPSNLLFSPEEVDSPDEQSNNSNKNTMPDAKESKSISNESDYSDTENEMLDESKDSNAEAKMSDNIESKNTPDSDSDSEESLIMSTNLVSPNGMIIRTWENWLKGPENMSVKEPSSALPLQEQKLDSQSNSSNNSNNSNSNAASPRKQWPHSPLQNQNFNRQSHSSNSSNNSSSSNSNSEPARKKQKVSHHSIFSNGATHQSMSLVPKQENAALSKSLSSNSNSNS